MQLASNLKRLWLEFGAVNILGTTAAKKEGTQHPQFFLPALMVCSFNPQVASSVGVKQFVVPGSTVNDSRGALELAQQKPNVSVAAAKE